QAVEFFKIGLSNEVPVVAGGVSAVIEHLDLCHGQHRILSSLMPVSTKGYWGEVRQQFVARFERVVGHTRRVPTNVKRREFAAVDRGAVDPYALDFLAQLGTDAHDRDDRYHRLIGREHALGRTR